jgi:hypothetical protein
MSQPHQLVGGFVEDLEAVLAGSRGGELAGAGQAEVRAGREAPFGRVARRWAQAPTLDAGDLPPSGPDGKGQAGGPAR